MSDILQNLLDLLDLETLEFNLFRGRARNYGVSRVFGGQVIGQALVAASRTVAAGRSPHSLHAYFLRPGDISVPIVYQVDRTRDGGSFTTRRVQAIQRGEAIFTMIASFHRAESGLEHQVPMPAIGPPELLRSPADPLSVWSRRGAPMPGHRALLQFFEQSGIEFRVGERAADDGSAQPRGTQCLWFRSAGRLPDSPLLHQCMLGYASDFNLLGTALVEHGGYFGQLDIITASIDHAMWFHRPMRLDDWLLYSLDSPSAQCARGFSRGQIFDRQGRLVASAAQEGLMRKIRPGSAAGTPPPGGDI